MKFDYVNVQDRERKGKYRENLSNIGKSLRMRTSK